MARRLFTSESVTEGHPDKVCDQVSDAILDAIIAVDPEAHVACETFATTGTLVCMGEVSTTASVPYEKIARDVVCDIGYDRDDIGFNGRTIGVLTSIHEQSADIALGVDRSFEYKEGQEDEANLRGAGDQGIMFGYACNETEEYMPLAAMYAHKLSMKLTEVRKNGTFDYLRPDGKTQVTVEYIDDKPARIDAVVLSTQHADSVSLEQLRADMTEAVIKAVIPAELIDENTKIYINPTGRFVIGGPAGDTGLTGRKIIVDTYGGAAKHGGGAFSGKDPTKVDRSAAYALRHIAKNIVAAGLADRCEIQAAYAIGVARPVSVMVDTFGTGRYTNDQIEEAVNRVFDLRPYSIIRDLRLQRPIYRKTAAYGHFGRNDADFTWEALDKTEELKRAIAE
ncbi:MAG: methionine adenosyltransferase [Clostridiales bacterium]|nr:methionine adenosyltransferase [Clostridiales bacterium]MDO5140533.1 methionine adenosyltransferase [Eubacteriales bacterium]